ncbi:hypothetical protein KIL84_003094 [Mauremys mutica]|uniref:Uncharacterized protein n=1 Tax=Mauremys mutica TaxID=74926 RepID=A0A9D4AT48_9SAUR|nr:hypothetical protein KIL84_003094 [Mauremys mutica]
MAWAALVQSLPRGTPQPVFIPALRRRGLVPGAGAGEMGTQHCQSQLETLTAKGCSLCGCQAGLARPGLAAGSLPLGVGTSVRLRWGRRNRTPTSALQSDDKL